MSRIKLDETSVAASASATASFLYELADRIETADGAEVLIGLWNTGFGGPEEFCFQVVIETEDSTRTEGD